MLLWENLKLALSAIRINKMRSFLTMLGMIIGISSVISIVSIGDTIRNVIADQYKNIGTGRAYSYIQTESDYYSDSDMYTNDDIDRILDVLGDDIEYISPSPSEKVSAINGRKKEDITLSGVRENFDKVQPSIEIVKGRMINEKDFLGKKENIVLESSTAEKLFGKKDAIGEKVRIVFNTPSGNDVKEMNVVGIYNNNQSVFMKLMGGQTIQTAYVPESILTSPDSSFWSIDIFTKNSVDLNKFTTRYKNLVSKIKNRTPNEIVFYTAQEDMAMIDGMMGGLSAAVGGIAAISLVVGGIGIMNIMLVSVTERTKEIGIRKALGARTKDILLQFLIESAIISAAGGVIGIILGAGTVLIGGLLVGINVVIKPLVIIIAVAFSAVIGIFFGLYPASKAAKQDPIVALRYE